MLEPLDIREEEIGPIFATAQHPHGAAAPTSEMACAGEVAPKAGSCIFFLDAGNFFQEVVFFS